MARRKLIPFRLNVLSGPGREEFFSSHRLSSGRATTSTRAPQVSASPPLKNDAANGADIAVIAQPHATGDMARGGHGVIGGIDVDPTKGWAKERGPGMRGIGPGQARFAGGRIGFEIAAHVTSGNSHGTQTSDFQVRKILANTAAQFENFLERRGNGGGFGVEFAKSR